MFFRASAARYRLDLVFADPPSALEVVPKDHSLTPGVFPHLPWPGPTPNPTQVSLLNLPSPSESSLYELPLLAPARRPRFQRGSPNELYAPFSTSSRAGPPTRASTPALFRLHRWSGLDGLLPARPCRPLSSGGTPGVARAMTMNPALLS